MENGRLEILNIVNLLQPTKAQLRSNGKIKIQPQKEEDDNKLCCPLIPLGRLEFRRGM